MLQERTYATVALLDTIDLFYAAGEPVQADVARVTSWNKALQCRVSRNSDLWQIGIHNELYGAYDKSLDVLNDIVIEVQSLVNPVVVKKVNPLIEQDDKLFYPVANYVSWDFLRIAVVSELSDIAPVDSYAQVLRWYACGHFPCGWRGKGGEKYPKGRLVIY